MPLCIDYLMTGVWGETVSVAAGSAVGGRRGRNGCPAWREGKRLEAHPRGTVGSLSCPMCGGHAFLACAARFFVPEGEPVEGAEHATEDGDKDHDIAFFDAEEVEDDELQEEPVEAEAATVPETVAPPRARAGDDDSALMERFLDARLMYGRGPPTAR